ncbi:MAG: hypothetical protein MUO82_06895 [Candidatus Thermoplasmatota archaeon]|nr:hypothetical protein [Candidatus Thermoplasmatota archaeon]
MDYLVHTKTASDIVNYGIIIPKMEYSAWPIWHLLSSSLNIITNIPIQNIPPISIGLPFPILLIYLISTEISNDKKIGLLSAFILAVSSYYISSATSMGADLFGITFTLLILYLILKNFSYLKGGVLIFIFFIALIFVHGPSTLMFILALIIIFLAEKILKKLDFEHQKIKIISIYIILFLFVVFFSHLMYISQNFFDSMLNALQFTLNPHEAGIHISPIEINIIDKLFDDIGNYIIIFFSIVGGLYIINKIKNSNQKSKYLSYKLCFVTPSIFLIVGYLSGFLQIAGPLQGTRFFVFSTPFLAILCAFGIILLFKYGLSIKIRSLKILLILLLVGILSIGTYFSVPNSAAAPGETNITYLKTPLGFTETEIYPANFMIKYNNNMSIHTSLEYSKYFKYGLNISIKNLETMFNKKLLDNGTYFLNEKHMIKQGVYFKEAYDFYDPENFKIISQEFINEKFINYNLIYNNNNITIYLV